MSDNKKPGADAVDQARQELATFDRVSARTARGLIAEVERLRTVLRDLHANYCTSAWTDRGRHAPECRLYEIGEHDGAPAVHLSAMGGGYTQCGVAFSPSTKRTTKSGNVTCAFCLDSIRAAKDAAAAFDKETDRHDQS